MRRKPQAALLKKIASIRDLQRIAAQARAARAAAALRERAAHLAEAEDARKSGEDAWMAFLAAPMLCVEAMPSWSAAMCRNDESVHLALDAVEAAKGELKQCSADWHGAEKRCDHAEESARKAMKGLALHREEAVLREVSGRHPLRRDWQ